MTEKINIENNIAYVDDGKRPTDELWALWHKANNTPPDSELIPEEERSQAWDELQKKMGIKGSPSFSDVKEQISFAIQALDRKDKNVGSEVKSLFDGRIGKITNIDKDNKCTVTFTDGKEPATIRLHPRNLEIHNK